MTEKTTETRYLAYARTATINDPAQPTSIEAQQEAMRLYVAERGSTIVGEYTDTEASGLRLNRPGFQDLLARLSQADAEAVLVTAPSRLGRGDSFYEAVSEIKSRGGRVESVVEQSSTFGNHSADFLMSLTRIMDDYLREEMKAKMMAKRAHMVAEGYYVGGKVSFGFRAEVDLADSRGYGKLPKRLVNDDRDAAIIRQAYALFLKGQSIKAVAEFLRTQSSQIATHRQTHRLLTNPVYSQIVGDDVFQAVQRIMVAKIIRRTR